MLGLLNSDMSVVSSGLKNNTCLRCQGCQHVVLKITIRTSILASKWEKQKQNNVCVFEFYALKFSQALLPGNLNLPDAETQSIIETLRPAAAATTSEPYGGRPCSRSLAGIISSQPPSLPGRGL